MFGEAAKLQDHAYIQSINKQIYDEIRRLENNNTIARQVLVTRSVRNLMIFFIK